MLTFALTSVSTMQSLRRYHQLRSGWSWDLAYYNQWFWALTQSDGVLSVRPIAAYAQEGPSIWKMNYLAPVRFVLAPIYALAPDPRTLLALQNVVFWWIIPASFMLVRSESNGSELAGLSAAALVPLTPLLWPLVWNDFRELQLAIPFVLWAVQGVRSRRPGLSTVGIGGMLACRQEFAIMAASFAFLPPRAPEGLTRTLRWRQSLFTLGMAWFLFGFLGYLRFAVAPGAPDQFIDQFLGPRATVLQTLGTASEFLACGLGAWAVLACFSPRVAILSLPWVWSLCNGRWAFRLLATEEWHSVRYTALPVAMILAAGLVGYGQLAGWLRERRGGWLALGLVWAGAAACCCPGLRAVSDRMSQIPETIRSDEAESLWHWIGQVGPEDGIVAAYEIAGPLSSRRRLYSYRMEQNKPGGFPELGPEFRWVFLREQELSPSRFLDQGFQIVHRGPFLTVLRRP
jgi:hypothetical protein